jgi:hypothetical protein
MQKLWTVLWWCAATATTVSSQAPRVLAEVHGAVGAEQSGSPNATTSLGDVNGDGIADFAVGSPGWPMPHPTIPGATIAQVGKARVYSGATQAVLFEVTGTYNLQALGRSTADIGDVDGDGAHDLAVGAPMFGPTVPGAVPPPPQVQVWSSAAGTPLYTIVSGSGGFASTNFGFSIDGVGDVGSLVGGVYSPVPDGVPDLVVGANSGGSAAVYSGANGAFFYALSPATVNGPPPSVPWLTGADDFGGVVAGIGDVNLDGLGDFAVGARNSALGGTVLSGTTTHYSGAVFVFSGDGSLLTALLGAAGDGLGTGLAGVGDLNGDGVPDFVAGAVRSDVGALDAGAVTAYSGATFAALWTAPGLVAADNFGFALSGAGDLDADGVPDVVVGTPTTDIGATNSGSVVVLSGANGARLGGLDGLAATDLLGRSVSGYADVDGDGFPEILAGAPAADVGASATGTVSIISYGAFLRPAAAGGVTLPGGATHDVLRIDGSAGGLPRRVDVAVSQPFVLSAVPPPAAPTAPLYVFGFFGVPGAADEITTPFFAGPLCFAPPALAPLDPRLFLLFDSFVAVDPTAVLPAVPPGPFTLAMPAGLPLPTRVALQGVLFDGAALVRTNAILLDVR